MHLFRKKRVELFISCDEAGKTAICLINEHISDSSFEFVVRNVELAEDMIYADRAGVKSTPAIQIDGRTVFTGIPSVQDLINLRIASRFQIRP